MGLTDEPKLYTVDPETGDQQMNTKTAGAVSFTGLSVGGTITHKLALDVDNWVLLTTRVGSNHLAVQNISGNGNVVLWNYDNTVGPGVGWRITDGGHKAVTIKENVLVYVRMLSGTGEVVVDETE